MKVGGMAEIALSTGSGFEPAPAAPAPQIRRASERDSAAALAIYNESIRRGEIGRHIRELTMNEFAAAMLAEKDRYPTYVAAVNGVIRGWSGVRPWHQRSAYASTVELLAYVAPSHRGRGLGKALISRAIAEAVHGEFHSIVALATADHDAAVRLGSFAGFVVAGALNVAFPAPDRVREVLLYQRMLRADDGR
jgi:L-amino acid N-acyltransferase YncA